jgi:hypothetical protein
MLTEFKNKKPKETFHQILERSLNNNFNSRPQKLEISGLLTPIHANANGRIFKFKLITDSEEYILNLNGDLYLIAKKVEWEEVTAKGIFIGKTKIFTVEHLILKDSPPDLQISSKISDFNCDLNFYIKTISKFGRLETELESLVS